MVIKIRRRERIINFILEMFEEAKTTNRFLDRNLLVARTCMGFSCGERLVKEIIKHLEVVGKIDFAQLELNPGDQT